MFHPRGPSLLELARQALSSTERGYDRLAPKFDFTPFRTPDAVLEPTARYLEREPFSRALDLCCGTGAVVSILRPLASDLVVGLDFSVGMLGVAQGSEGLRRRGAASAFVRADALRPPFSRAFDLVTCFSALGHFLPFQHETLVRSVGETLRPGGRFVFVTGTLPRVSSRAWWMSRAFNAAMHVRNALWSPPFVMYYLTFLLPEARALLSREGFSVDVVEGLFSGPFERLVLVDARLQGFPDPPPGGYHRPGGSQIPSSF
jgi:SAM-dependent methyltransferase